MVLRDVPAGRPKGPLGLGGSGGKTESAGVLTHPLSTTIVRLNRAPLTILREEAFQD